MQFMSSFSQRDSGVDPQRSKVDADAEVVDGK